MVLKVKLMAGIEEGFFHVDSSGLPLTFSAHRQTGASHGASAFGSRYSRLLHGVCCNVIVLGPVHELRAPQTSKSDGLRLKMLYYLICETPFDAGSIPIFSRFHT